LQEAALGIDDYEHRSWKGRDCCWIGKEKMKGKEMGVVLALLV